MFFLVFFLFASLSGSEHVTLDLSFSADGSAVPSRALLAHLKIGIPEQSYGLMLDFNASEIEIDRCMYLRSRTYDMSGGDSDVVLFEEEQLVSAEPRGYFRLPVEQHCEEHSMAERYYVNCLSDACRGVLGMSRRSTMWQIWTSFTLSLERLHLGRTNPHHRTEPGVYDRVLQCSGSSTEQLCEYAATIGGVDVTVDFHTDNSYIYVPQELYAMYMADLNPSRVHGSERVLSLNGTASQRFERALSAEADASRETPRRRVTEFKSRLHSSVKRAIVESRYFRNALHTYTHSDWPPIVIEPRNSGTATLVLDYDLLVHSPTYSGSYGNTERSSTQSFFGESSDLLLTILLKPHPDNGPQNANRVSIGNGFLRRYTFHKNILERRVLVEQRVLVEHLSTLEVLTIVVLFTVFVRSLCYSLEMLAPLGLCLCVSCPDCKREELTSIQHRRVTLHSARESVIFICVLAVPPYMLTHLSYFVDPYKEWVMYTWAWTTLLANAICLLVTLTYAWISANANRPASGSLCWRSFRMLLSRCACSEHLALLGVLLTSFVLRRETLGSAFSSFVVCAMIFNSTRHVYQALRVHSSQRNVAEMLNIPMIDVPSHENNTLWTLFVALVLLLVNTLTLLPFAHYFVLMPALRSANLSSLVSVGCVAFGTFLVEIHGFRELKRRTKSARQTQ